MDRAKNIKLVQKHLLSKKTYFIWRVDLNSSYFDKYILGKWCNFIFKSDGKVKYYVNSDGDKHSFDG